jgi:hypothetical protein
MTRREFGEGHTDNQTRVWQNLWEAAIGKQKYQPAVGLQSAPHQLPPNVKGRRPSTPDGDRACGCSKFQVDLELGRQKRPSDHQEPANVPHGPNGDLKDPAKLDKKLVYLS